MLLEVVVVVVVVMDIHNALFEHFDKQFSRKIYLLKI
jgi:hypothetical protein